MKGRSDDLAWTDVTGANVFNRPWAVVGVRGERSEGERERKRHGLLSKCRGKV